MSGDDIVLVPWPDDSDEWPEEDEEWAYEDEGYDDGDGWEDEDDGLRRPYDAEESCDPADGSLCKHAPASDYESPTPQDDEIPF